MAWTVQWRTKGDLIDAVFVLDERGEVHQAIPANQPVLSRFLTEMGDLATWRGESSVDNEDQNGEAWGQLVLSRSSSGEVIEVEPELFWHGIYLWFRSRGVDYDTPGQEASSPPYVVQKPPRSSLMDD